MNSELETLTAKADALQARLDAFGRPMPDFGGLRRTLQGAAPPGAMLEPIREWAAAHPDEAREYETILAELDAVEREVRRLRAARDKEAAMRGSLEALGIGSRTVAALETVDTTAALTGTQQWLVSGGWALVLTGGVGTGKTLAAAYAVREAVERHQARGYYRSGEPPPALWLSVSRDSRAQVFGPEAQERENRWRLCGLLVVDDVGAEFASEAWRSLLASVLDARWESERRTILTSNLGVVELRERLGARTMDRLAQGGRVVSCGDRSLRRSA